MHNALPNHSEQPSVRATTHQAALLIGALLGLGCADHGPDKSRPPSGVGDSSTHDTQAPDSGAPDADTDSGAQDSHDTADDDTGAPPEEPIPLNHCGENRTGERATGTPEDPVQVPYWPMVDIHSTAEAPTDQWDRYDCAPDTLETGPEILYKFQIDSRGSFRAELRELNGSDIDLHLLQDPTLTDGMVSGCIARGHQRIYVEDLAPGEYWLALDSWSNGSTEFAGGYELAFEWLKKDQWREIDLGEGLRWRSLRTDTDGGQSIEVLEMNPDEGRRMRPELHSACETVASHLDSASALAGINGGFFGVSGCNSLDWLKADNQLLSHNQLNGLAQRAIGWVEGRGLTSAWIEAGADWAEARDGISGYPSLVTGGVAAAEREPDDPVVSSIDWTSHPRSALGLTGDGRLLLVTVAGRTAAGAGLTTPRLAEWMVDLGAVDALGLDGGGSTTLVIPGCWVDGVVNQPSDNGVADWRGSRGVADGLYIY